MIAIHNKLINIFMLQKKHNTFSGSIEAPSVVEPRKPHCRRFEPKYQHSICVIHYSSNMHTKKLNTSVSM